MQNSFSLPSLNDECQLIMADVSSGLDIVECESIFSGCCTINDESTQNEVEFSQLEVILT